MTSMISVDNDDAQISSMIEYISITEVRFKIYFDIDISAEFVETHFVTTNRISATRYDRRLVIQ